MLHPVKKAGDEAQHKYSRFFKTGCNGLCIEECLYIACDCIFLAILYSPMTQLCICIHKFVSYLCTRVHVYCM